MGDFSEYRNKYMFSNKRKYYTNVDNEEIKREVKILRSYIKKYNINLTALSRDIPEDEARNTLLDIAYFIIDEEKLIKHFEEKKILPKTYISGRTMTSISLIDRYIDYLKLYTVLLMNNQFKEIVSYLNIQEKDESKKRFKDINSNHKQEVYKGISIQISRYAKSIFILTRQGIVADVKYIEGCNSGDEVLSTRFKYIPTKVRFTIGILAVLSFIGMILFSVYERSNTKIVINTTSEINLKINNFNKVIYANSPTDKGKQLINTEKLEHDSVDDALLGVLKYADSNDMIPESGIIRLFIGGKDFNIKLLPKFTEYVENQYIDETKKGKFFKVEINNNGVQKDINADRTKEKKKKKE